MWSRPLIEENKTRARALLYLVPVVLVAVGLLSVHRLDWVAEDFWWRHVDWEEYEEVRLLQEYVRIDTTNPGGNEILGAEFLAGHLEAMGLEVHLERVGETHANLWAILEGETAEALVLHSHLDTDPIREPEKWLEPPFGGTILPPYLVGRGAFDMKSVTIAQLLALRDLAEAPERPRRSVVFLATGDEEAGSWLGMRRWLDLHPELVERFWGALSEGGAVEALSSDDVKYWGTEFAQRLFAPVTLCSSDPEVLRNLRDELERAESEKVWMSAAAAEFFRSYGPSRPNPDYARVLGEPEELTTPDQLAGLTFYTRDMVRNELVLEAVEEDPTGGYRLRGNLLLVPGLSIEEGLEDLLPRGWAGAELQIERPHGPVGPSPTEHAVFRTIDRVLSERFPGTPHGPLLLPWTYTDSRFLRAAGVPSWGFSPFRIVASDSHKLGGSNERITLPELVDGVDLYREVVRRVVSESSARDLQ